jgi:hypothetical protein
MLALQNVTRSDLRHPRGPELRARSVESVLRWILHYGPKSRCGKRSPSDRRPACHSGSWDRGRDQHPGLVPASGHGARHPEQLRELREHERFVRRHPSNLICSPGIDLERSPSDTTFRNFFVRMEVRAMFATNRNWRSPKSLLVQRILINFSVNIKPCTARPNPQQVAGRRSLPRPRSSQQRLFWPSARPAMPAGKT